MKIWNVAVLVATCLAANFSVHASTMEIQNTCKVIMPRGQTFEDTLNGKKITVTYAPVYVIRLIDYEKKIDYGTYKTIFADYIIIKGWKVVKAFGLEGKFFEDCPEDTRMFVELCVDKLGSFIFKPDVKFHMPEQMCKVEISEDMRRTIEDLLIQFCKKYPDSEFVEELRLNKHEYPVVE